MRRRRAAPGVAVALAVALAAGPSACGDDPGTRASSPEGGPAATATGLPPIDPAQTLPPNDLASLRRLYDPVLEPMGLTLTRGMLVDRSNGGYEPSDTGTHLALYVEPTRTFSTAEFVERLWTLSALVTPDAFARWSGLASYDICQEPNPGEDDRPEPFPITQLDVTREAAATIDWRNGDLTDLLVASRTVPDVIVRTNRVIRSSPEFAAADAAAEAEIEASGLTTLTTARRGVGG